MFQLRIKTVRQCTVNKNLHPTHIRHSPGVLQELLDPFSAKLLLLLLVLLHVLLGGYSLLVLRLLAGQRLQVLHELLVLELGV